MAVFLDRFPQSFPRVAVFSPIVSLQYDGSKKMMARRDNQVST
jgi:hypothetical protein